MPERIQKPAGTGAVGAETGRRRWAALTGYFTAGHEGSVKENAQGRSQPVEALSATHGPIMEPSSWLEFSARARIFAALLRRNGLLGPAFAMANAPAPSAGE